MKPVYLSFSLSSLYTFMNLHIKYKINQGEFINCFYKFYNLTPKK